MIKIFSDFYYVETQVGIVECKRRTVLKKQKEDIYTGDFVELEQFEQSSMQAFIGKVVDRKNLISKPKVANISQVIIVSALKEPDLSFEQLDRYIAHCEYHKITPVLCFNKEDIQEDIKLKEKILNTYQPLNYKVVFTSAIKKTGIEELKPVLKNNTSILCGSSGVGKSSLINALLNSSRLRTLPISEKTKKGVHTTRHCELIEIEDRTLIVDTPGFSHLKFDFLLPAEIQKLFVEFKYKEFDCKFKDCLHIGEIGCGAEKIIKETPQERYESYKKFVTEAKEYEEEISKKSIKKEENVKYNQNRMMAKISNKKRGTSRKTNKQNMYKNEM